ncbi:MAG TPA: helix-turn-helix domain-containing protein [Bacillota bacterium]
MCPRYEKAAELLGKKWTGLILRVLLDGPKRFAEFKEQLPEVSDRILSERLKELEEAGVVERRVHNTRPVLIQYALTPKGRDARRVVEAIQAWAERWW